jgi:hypothetical protein
MGGSIGFGCWVSYQYRNRVLAEAHKNQIRIFPVHMALLLPLHCGPKLYDIEGNPDVSKCLTLLNLEHRITHAI